MEKLLLTTVEAARILCVGRSRIYQLMNNGELESIKVGGSRRIAAESLEQYVAQQLNSLRDGAA